MKAPFRFVCRHGEPRLAINLCQRCEIHGTNLASLLQDLADHLARRMRAEDKGGAMRKAAHALMFLLLSTGHALSQSGDHGDGHAEHHDVYRAWMRPGTAMSCCNHEDCRPTLAYKEDDGLWRAWNGNRWLIVPPGTMLPADYAGDGRSHLCASAAGAVYCFSPAEPKG